MFSLNDCIHLVLVQYFMTNPEGIRHCAEPSRLISYHRLIES